MKKLFTFFALALFSAINAMAETTSGTVKMTYINGSDSDTGTSYGEVTTAVCGYNKISGGKVELSNKGWNVNNIVYLQVDASTIPEKATITKVTLTAKVSGSTDSKRTTAWGVGYNSSAWSSTLTWKTADRSITTIGGTQSTSTKSASTYEEKTFEITDAFADDADKIATILVFETAPAGGNIKDVSATVEYSLIPQANFTVKYVCNGEEIKNATTLSGSVGSQPVLTNKETDNFINADNTKKYIYVSDDSNTKTISEDGNVVVTVTFREAATYNYSIVSDKGDVVSTGFNFEGEKVDAGYPRYYLNKSDSTLVEAGKYSTDGKQYRKSITLDADNKQETVAYNKGTKNRIAFYTEGEDIAGAVTTTSWNNVAVRASNALAATTTEDLYITSLPAGKYKIHVGCFTDGKGQTIKLALGDRILNFFVPAGNNNANLYEVASQEIAISKTTQLLLLADGLNTNKNLLDYLYVEKTGHMEESKYGDWMESEGGEYDPNNGLAPSEKFPTGSIESPTRPDNGLITFPEEDTENSDAVGTVTGIDSASAAVKVVAIYTANGKRVNALQKGINIVTLSDGKRVKIIK